MSNLSVRVVFGTTATCGYCCLKLKGGEKYCPRCKTKLIWEYEELPYRFTGL